MQKANKLKPLYSATVTQAQNLLDVIGSSALWARWNTGEHKADLIDAMKNLTEVVQSNTFIQDFIMYTGSFVQKKYGDLEAECKVMVGKLEPAIKTVSQETAALVQQKQGRDSAFQTKKTT